VVYGRHCAVEHPSSPSRNHAPGFTIFLNLILPSVVLFYVYSLKFIFTAAS
jgi:hypothetical protein